MERHMDITVENVLLFIFGIGFLGLMLSFKHKIMRFILSVAGTISFVILEAFSSDIGRELPKGTTIAEHVSTYMSYTDTNWQAIIFALSIIIIVSSTIILLSDSGMHSNEVATDPCLHVIVSLLTYSIMIGITAANYNEVNEKLDTYKQAYTINVDYKEIQNLDDSIFKKTHIYHPHYPSGHYLEKLDISFKMAKTNTNISGLFDNKPTKNIAKIEVTPHKLSHDGKLDLVITIYTKPEKRPARKNLFKDTKAAYTSILTGQISEFVDKEYWLSLKTI